VTKKIKAEIDAKNQQILVKDNITTEEDEELESLNKTIGED